VRDLVDRKGVSLVKAIIEALQAICTTDVTNGSIAECLPVGCSISFCVENSGDTAVVVGIEQDVDPINRLLACGEKLHCRFGGRSRGKEAKEGMKKGQRAENRR
jgi:hypothetical protein